MISPRRRRGAEKISYQLNELSAKQAISNQLSAVSLNRTPKKGSPNTEGNGSQARDVWFSRVPVWRKPEHRRALGERPEGGADRMSAPDLRGRMPRKIGAGPKARGAQGWVAPSGVSFSLATFSWTSKRK